MRQSKYFPLICVSATMTFFVIIGMYAAFTLYDAYIAGGFTYRGTLVTMDSGPGTFMQLAAMSAVAVVVGILTAIRGPAILLKWWTRHHRG